MPSEVFKKLGAQGLLGIKVPVEYGGLDLDWMTLGLVTEQLAYYDFSLGMGSCSRTSLGMLPIIQNGSEEQRKKYLPGTGSRRSDALLCNGGAECRSDATAIETTAIADGDDYVINGNKTWITNANHANFAMVVCQTDKSKGEQRIRSDHR